MAKIQRADNKENMTERLCCGALSIHFQVSA